MALCITCYARDEYTVTDNTDTFTISFDYVIPEDVNVAVRNSTTKEYEPIPRTSWVFENLTTIKISPPPGSDVVIYRCTDVSEPKAKFFPGNSIQAVDLNANQRQVLNAIEELRCTIANLSVDGGGNSGGDGGSGGSCSTDNDCLADEICYDGTCTKTCSVTSDCPPGYVCYNGVCILECTVDSNCPEGQECYQGICLVSCSVDNDCPPGFVCSNGVCLEPCSLTSDCSLGFECVNGVCLPVDDGADAPLDGKLYGRQDNKWTLAIPYDFTLLTTVSPPNVTQPVVNNKITPRSNVSVTDAPSDGKLYGRQSADWSPALTYLASDLPNIGITTAPDPGTLNISTQAINEAPADGLQYGRKDANWYTSLQYNISTLNELPKGNT